jgi:hypothetical protein
MDECDCMRDLVTHPPPPPTQYWHLQGVLKQLKICNILCNIFVKGEVMHSKH